jgi:glycosyltransferase involved in cell wall biosynthesis
MHIIFNPPDNDENKYIENVVKPLLESNFQVHALEGLFSSLGHFRSIRLVHLNWFENIDDTSTYKTIVSFLRKTLVLTILRLSGKKLIWTMHNRISHEKKSGKFSQLITEKLVQWADLIIIHSSQSRNLLITNHPEISDKIKYLPHPDFIGNYGPLVVSKEKNPDILRLLFLGAVKPYKNIELLIDVIREFSGKVKLTIAGKTNSTAYQKKIMALASSAQNLNLILEFIPDSQLPNLLSNCDLVILPYDLASSLNSGTVMLAFSYQKSIICPEIGTLEDMKAMGENFLTYRYQSPSEHPRQLRKSIEKAIRLKNSDKEVFEKMGRNMFEYVSDKHNKAAVGEKLKTIYTSILS